MKHSTELSGISPANRFLKRSFDLVLSAAGLMLTWWIILIAALIARLDTGMNGFFTQVRVGRNGEPFTVIKIRTMKSVEYVNTTVSTSNDVRITRCGRILRKTKLDELPQLINILLGDMSFVGPRPDVPGYADQLSGENRIILTVRPGLTGPATLHYRNEEELLHAQSDPEIFNREKIYPHKTQLNRRYISEYSFLKDIRYLVQTIFG